MAIAAAVGPHPLRQRRVLARGCPTPAGLAPTAAGLSRCQDERTSGIAGWARRPSTQDSTTLCAEATSTSPSSSPGRCPRQPALGDHSAPTRSARRAHGPRRPAGPPHVPGDRCEVGDRCDLAVDAVPNRSRPARVATHPPGRPQHQRRRRDRRRRPGPATAGIRRSARRGPRRR